MNAVVASGMSERSKAWAEQIAEGLEAAGIANHPLVLQYEHWTQPEADFDLDRESGRLGELFEGQAQPCSVFAKSIGTVVTLKAINDKLVRPAGCVFVGTPFGWKEPEEKFALSSLLESYGRSLVIPSLFIQASKDPAGKYLDLVKKLHESGFSNPKLVEVPGEDHDYRDVDRVSRLAASAMMAAT